MSATEKILWKVYAGVLGAVSTLVAQKLVHGAWKFATGDEPPEPNDPNTPIIEAVIWALASGVGVGVVQLLTNRFAARRFATDFGTPAPSLGGVKRRG